MEYQKSKLFYNEKRSPSPIKSASPQVKLGNYITNNENSIKKSLKKVSHCYKNDKTKHSTRKFVKDNQQYVFNRTTVGTPYDKSTMLSYLSTPNEQSQNMIHLYQAKKIKSPKNSPFATL